MQCLAAGERIRSEETMDAPRLSDIAKRAGVSIAAVSIAARKVKPLRRTSCVRARVLAICSTFSLVAPLRAVAREPSKPVVVVSPGGEIRAQIAANEHEGLSYVISWKGRQLAPPAHIGLRIEEVRKDAKGTAEIGLHCNLGDPTTGHIDESYRFLGAKTVAVNRANTVTIPIRESDGTLFTVEARAYDDGFAWRLLLPNGDAPIRVLEETSTWVLPAGEVWFGERNNDWKLKTYAGDFRHVNVNGLPAVSRQGPIQMPPLLVELQDARGYELITEAALANYSGMRLRAAVGRTLHVNFTEGTEGFRVKGPIATPWRVTMLCPDLNCLVNNTLTENLNPPPDPALFRDTSYIRAGRSVWRYMSRETGSPAQEKEFVDFAAELGYEYTLVDDGWKTWPAPWPDMGRLTAYARTKNVGVFAWKDSSEIDDPANDYATLRDFLDHAAQAGLAGVKIDFINTESKVKIDFERQALQLAAMRRLMVDFHGIQKPTGEERTFPNGLTREGVRGIELNRMSEGPISASHNAALPFTRLAVGPADYTPMSLNWSGSTTWSHQLATAILLSSPLLVIAEDPQFLLKSPDVMPALAVIQELPAIWDETIVLPGSRAGGITGMARRKGDVWFIAAINGESSSARLPSLPLEVHLERYSATVIVSPEKRSFGASTYRDAALWVHDEMLRPGDGLVAVLKPKSLPVSPSQGH